MKIEEFRRRGEQVSAQAGVLDGLHGYFKLHAARLHRACELFQLFDKLGDVLEIGPFYGYMPFILRENSKSYSVFEGDDPAVRPLEKLYRENSVALSYVDFFEIFGPTHTATHKLPLPDASFDTLLCWETMEHFNFNPVKFVRELYRVLRPGGRVCITVPNKASFQCQVSLVTGRLEKKKIEDYYKFEDYESNGKKAFFGFHWREYTPPELRLLFAGCGFKLQSSGSFTVFQDHGSESFGRRILRAMSRVGTKLLPRYGNNVYLIATK